MWTCPSFPIIDKDPRREEKEEDQERINLQVIPIMPLWARKEFKNTVQMGQNMEDQKKSYHYKLGKMIAKVKKETKWRDIFKIVEKAQKKLKGGK